jgi:KUP system potassium uptake protein
LILLLVISVEYLTVLLRFDNKGEGGVLVLANIATRNLTDRPKLMLAAGTLGLIGASLICGDGIITPAISVLSAVEGLNVALSIPEHYIVWIALIVLLGLFLVQGHGTERIGKVFGPIMTIWFVALAAIGVNSLIQTPKVLLAINPIRVELHSAPPRRGLHYIGGLSSSR